MSETKQMRASVPETSKPNEPTWNANLFLFSIGAIILIAGLIAIYMFHGQFAGV